MLTISEALGRILSEVPYKGDEVVPIQAAYDRVLSRDLIAPVQVPGFDNSAMDGYAVRATDTDAAGVTLRLVEVIAAGKEPTEIVKPGTASAVMTGAPIPSGADAVVIIENTSGAMTGEVTIRHQARPGDHIRRAGQDVQRGSCVLAKGTVLGPAQVGLAGSLGLAALPVVQKPRVAILSTGDEVVAAGAPLRPGQIYSSNNLTLVGLVREAGCLSHDLGNVGDDLDAILEALDRALEADVVVTTGGVSVGSYDFVKEAFAQVGAEIDFWKVAMKPGKPLAFGMVQRGNRRIPLFGLPGNPVSCMVNFLEFVRPYLCTSMGRADTGLRVVDAIAQEAFRVRPGRAKLERVRLGFRSGSLGCWSTGNQSSGVLSSMAQADGLLLIPAESNGYEAGQPVRVQLINPRWVNQPGEALFP
jgi:molybdopterin molybdotransferase